MPSDKGTIQYVYCLYAHDFETLILSIFRVDITRYPGVDRRKEMDLDVNEFLSCLKLLPPENR